MLCKRFASNFNFLRWLDGFIARTILHIIESDGDGRVGRGNQEEKGLVEGRRSPKKTKKESAINSSQGDVTAKMSVRSTLCYEVLNKLLFLEEKAVVKCVIDRIFQTIESRKGHSNKLLEDLADKCRHLKSIEPRTDDGGK